MGPPLPEEDPPVSREGYDSPPPPPLSKAPMDSHDPPPPPPEELGPSAPAASRRQEGSARDRSKSEHEMARKGGVTVGRTREEDIPMASGPTVALAPGTELTEMRELGFYDPGPTYYPADRVLLRPEVPDQTDVGVTQVGPGSLPVPSGDTQPWSSVPSSLFDLPFDIAEGEHVVEGVLPRTQAVGPNFG